MIELTCNLLSIKRIDAILIMDLPPVEGRIKYACKLQCGLRSEDVPVVFIKYIDGSWRDMIDCACPFDILGLANSLGIPPAIFNRSIQNLHLSLPLYAVDRFEIRDGFYTRCGSPSPDRWLLCGRRSPYDPPSAGDGHSPSSRRRPSDQTSRHPRYFSISCQNLNIAIYLSHGLQAYFFHHISHTLFENG